MKTERLVRVDALRGVAALMVAWFHLTGSTGSVSDAVRWSGAYGWTGVEMFFVISGFVIPLAMYRGGYSLGARSVGRYLAKRLIRLEPPYWASIALVLGLSVLASHGSNATVVIPTSAQLWLHLGYVIPFTDHAWLVPVYWTLAVEFQYYVGLALLYPVLVRANDREAWPMLTVLAVASLAFRDLEFFWPRYAPFFVMGLCLARVHLGRSTWQGARWVLAVATLCGAVVLGVAATLAGLLAVLLIAVPWSPNRALRWLGTVSYSLYLTHWTVGAYAVAAGRHVPGLNDSPLGLRLVALVGVLGFAHLFWRVCELPAQQWAGRIKYQGAHRLRHRNVGGLEHASTRLSGDHNLGASLVPAKSEAAVR